MFLKIRPGNRGLVLPTTQDLLRSEMPGSSSSRAEGEGPASNQIMHAVFPRIRGTSCFLQDGLFFNRFSFPWENCQASFGSQDPQGPTCFLLWTRISQANTAMLLFVSQKLRCAGNEGCTLDQPRDSVAKPLIYSVGTAGHPSCNKNKMSLWPRAPNLLLNPHFKESYYTRVRLNQTKLQCLRTVAHF